jgi:hypothetical protein
MSAFGKCQGVQTRLIYFWGCSPAAGTIATFDFTKCRHISLVARKGSYNNLLPLWRGAVWLAVPRREAIPLAESSLCLLTRPAAADPLRRGKVPNVPFSWPVNAAGTNRRSMEFPMREMASY